MCYELAIETEKTRRENAMATENRKIKEKKAYLV